MLTGVPGRGVCSEGAGLGISEGSVDTSLIDIAVGVLDISDDSVELQMDDGDGTLLKDCDGTALKDGNRALRGDGT